MELCITLWSCSNKLRLVPTGLPYPSLSARKSSLMCGSLEALAGQAERVVNSIGILKGFFWDSDGFWWMTMAYLNDLLYCLTFFDIVGPCGNVPVR